MTISDLKVSPSVQHDSTQQYTSTVPNSTAVPPVALAKGFLTKKKFGYMIVKGPFD